VGSLAFVLALCLQLTYRTVLGGRGYDLYFPFCAARAILDGIDPYAGTCAIVIQHKTYPSNPLTAVLPALPFVWFGYLGAIAMWSCFVGMMVFGLLKDGEYWRLLVLFSAPFWSSFQFLQWSPLITAVLFLPALLPLALVKPQSGLPVIVTNMTRTRAIACLAFAAATLLVDPRWPLKWWPQALNYDGVVPVLVAGWGGLLLGLIVFLVLLDWRERRTLFLAVSAIMPQRGIYDALPLATLNPSARQVVAWSVLSWIAFAAGPFFQDRPRWLVPLIYLPLVASRIHDALALRSTRATRLAARDR